MPRYRLTTTAYGQGSTGLAAKRKAIMKAIEALIIEHGDLTDASVMHLQNSEHSTVESCLARLCWRKVKEH